MLCHPSLDRRISFDRTGESQKLAHGEFISTLGPARSGTFLSNEEPCPNLGVSPELNGVTHVAGLFCYRSVRLLMLRI
jgi:hypothetical protein